MSLSHHHKKGYNYIVQLLQHNISTVLQQKQKTKKRRTKRAAKQKQKQILRGIIKFQYYLHQRS